MFSAPVLVVGLSSVLVAGVLLAATPASAVAPGSPQCNALGGNTIAQNTPTNTTFVHTFTAGGMFTPKQAMTVNYLVVGGGGGGGGSNGTTVAGGGGGGGDVQSNTVALTAGTAYTVVVGAGGTGGAAGTTIGTAGTSSTLSGGVITTVTATGGGAGGAGGGTTNANRNGGAGASGGGGAGRATAGTAGTASAGNNGGVGRGTVTRAGGGGGGDGGAITAVANAVGGAGGAGTLNIITGSATARYGAGGGGGSTTGGAAGTGGAGTGGSGSTAPVAGTANTGAGGGGRGITSGVGATGGSGIVIISYTKNVGCPSNPTSVAFSTPNLSWTLPTPPGAQTISSVTVTYRQAGDTTIGNIYARSTAGSATSINILGKTQAACLTNNPAGWTCNASIGGTLTTGTWLFSVFVRTNTNALSKMSTGLPVSIP